MAPTPRQAIKQTMHVPVRFGLVGPNGADLDYASVEGGKVEGDVLHLTRPESG